jgi:ankyrin repeat protein
VRAGSTEELTALLAQRLPPNLRNAQGDSLLILAAYHGHGEMVRLLLEAGADTEMANDRGQTALCAAAFRGDAAIVRMLLGHGAQVQGSPGGCSAFTVAAMFDRVEVMELLRGQGADPWARDAGGLNALEAAQKMGADEAVLWLGRQPPA